MLHPQTPRDKLAGALFVGLRGEASFSFFESGLALGNFGKAFLQRGAGRLLFSTGAEPFCVDAGLPVLSFAVLIGTSHSLTFFKLFGGYLFFRLFYNGSQIGIVHMGVDVLYNLP